MATMSAYKCVTSSWTSAGLARRDERVGWDPATWATLSLVYTVGSTVVPDFAAEAAARAAHRPEFTSDATTLPLLSGIHAWQDDGALTGAAVYACYQCFRNLLVDQSGHMIRVTYNDPTDVIRSASQAGDVSGIGPVNILFLSSCTVAEEFTKADIDAGYGH